MCRGTHSHPLPILHPCKGTISHRSDSLSFDSTLQLTLNPPFSRYIPKLHALCQPITLPCKI